MGSRIIAALDNVSLANGAMLADKLEHHIWGVKINSLLLENAVDGGSPLSWLTGWGHTVFADAKLHDIPNTVANSVGVLARQGAHLITVHASGGVEMMRAAVETYEKNKPEDGLGILAVTILTSLDANHCRGIYGKEPEEMVLKLADFAEKAGVYGIVCSAQELVALKGKYPRLKRVVPGTRSKGADTHDQARVDTQENAIANGADLLVIGREITKDDDPVAVCKRINALG